MKTTTGKTTTHSTRKISAGGSSSEKTVDVLYQKMGERWFAFSTVGDDVFVGSISPEELESATGSARNQKTYKITGNS